MFKNKGISTVAMLVIIVVLLAAGYFIYEATLTQEKKEAPGGQQNENNGGNNETTNPGIQVESPQPNAQVTSPIAIAGQARGTWFFEAVFPITLENADGTVIAETQAQAIGDWMTTDFVPFTASLDFAVPAKTNATLVLAKDNPSGLPENAAAIRIPVVLMPTVQAEIDFTQTGNLIKDNPGLKPGVWYLSYEASGKPAQNVELSFDANSACMFSGTMVPCQQADLQVGTRVTVEGNQTGNIVLVSSMAAIKESGQERTVSLYYYNPELDKDASGNVLCSRKGLVAVSREIPVTQTPIQDTIRLLIAGNLTSAERAQGIGTEFPLAGFSLTGASLNNGTLTLEFSDPNNKTSGGSCRAGILWFQIEATAKQFPGVNIVKFIPDTLFQP